MKRHTHLKIVTRQRPASAALSPVWELFYLSESLLGLIGGYAGLGLQFLGGITAFLQVISDIKGGPSQS